MRGTGYRFSAPAHWPVSRTTRVVRVSEGLKLLSVTRYALVHPFRPSLWPQVRNELDDAAAGVARQQGGTVSSSRTTTVAGRRARTFDIRYRHESKDLVERITFLLRDATEYYLLCRYEDGGDTRACDRLLATFTLD